MFEYERVPPHQTQRSLKLRVVERDPIHHNVSVLPEPCLKRELCSGHDIY